jgi:NAD(P) transhydrogenase
MCHAFDVPSQAEPLEMPFGIWTIPEISAIGPTERELTEEAVPYEIGIARYREIARGQIVGDTDGTLKILFHRETLKVLAVHIIGEGAADLVHIGQVAVTLGGTLDYFIEAVFNYPTLAECYKVAALDGLNRVRSTQGLPEASYPPQEQTSED